jgi:hypothetical protein
VCRWVRVSYSVVGLLRLVALLVGLGFGLVWQTLGLAECLPALTKTLSDLTCEEKDMLVVSID